MFDYLVLEANGSEDIQSLGKTNGFSETLWANHSWKEVCIILPYLDSSIFFEFYNKFLFLRCFSVQVLVYTIIDIRQRRVAKTAHSSCFRVTHFLGGGGGGGGRGGVFAHGLQLCKLFCGVIVSIPELFLFRANFPP